MGNSFTVISDNLLTDSISRVMLKNFLTKEEKKSKIEVIDGSRLLEEICIVSVTK